MNTYGGMIGGKVVEHNLYRKNETKTFDYFDDNDYDSGAELTQREYIM